MTDDPRLRVVALVAAKDAAGTVGHTVAALCRLPAIDDVLVVDDGSTDGTSEAALGAGAGVLRLDRNQGKGGAVAAGVAATPETDVYVLVDADVGATAAAIADLIPPVATGQADMVVGVLPSAGAKGGFGLVRTVARAGIRRATGGFVAVAPLSGQRVVRGPLLRRLTLAPRFGLETALTIDAVRAGASVVEVPVAMDHRHTGRGLSGFFHRGRQGIDVVRALWPRVTSSGGRIALIAGALIPAAGARSGARSGLRRRPDGNGMRTILARLGAGFLAGRLAWVAAKPVFASPALARPNYRGHVVPTATGALLPVAAIVVEAGAAVAAVMNDEGRPDAARVPVLASAVGFALLGLIDDVAGSATDRGFGGHLGALAHGRLTTGGVKLVGGAALALAVAGPVAGGSPGRLLADASLVALAANLGNLFDRAPGRSIKVAAAGFAGLAAATAWEPGLGPVGVVVGAGLGLLLDDLHENLMLGDAGANVLGATLGLGTVLACAPATRNVVLAVVAVLNLAAEKVSFSRVIDAVPPLRALDRLGRLRAGAS